MKAGKVTITMAAGKDIELSAFPLCGLMLKTGLSYTISETGVPQFSFKSRPLDLVIVHGTVVFIKRHFQFVHFVGTI